MIRGTTPTHTFTLPITVDQISDIRISYAQRDKELIVKRLVDCTTTGNTISVTLTQEDTFKFDSKKQAQVQIRVLTKTKKVLSNNIILISVEQSINNEVL